MLLREFASRSKDHLLTADWAQKADLVRIELQQAGNESATTPISQCLHIYALKSSG